jgi:hypothetical protein
MLAFILCNTAIGRLPLLLFEGLSLLCCTASVMLYMNSNRGLSNEVFGYLQSGALAKNQPVTFNLYHSLHSVVFDS